MKDKTLEPFIRTWNLLPSKGGVFELTINGEKVYSKKALGRHAEPGEARGLIVDRIRALVPNYDDIIAAMSEEH